MNLQVYWKKKIERMPLLGTCECDECVLTLSIQNKRKSKVAEMDNGFQLVSFYLQAGQLLPASWPASTCELLASFYLLAGQLLPASWPASTCYLASFYL
jgi:hypothetical protein